jgi:hypothetical protein
VTENVKVDTQDCVSLMKSADFLRKAFVLSSMLLIPNNDKEIDALITKMELLETVNKHFMNKFKDLEQNIAKEKIIN